jgi:hypothetical protein
VESDPYYFGNRVAGLKFYIDESGTNPLLTGTSPVEMENSSTLRAFPNPAREYMKISFESMESEHTSINILDLKGSLVKSLGSEYPSPGVHEYTWNLDNDEGQRVSSGIYICTLVSGDQRQSLRLVVE